MKPRAQPCLSFPLLQRHGRRAGPWRVQLERAEEAGVCFRRWKRYSRRRPTKYGDNANKYRREEHSHICLGHVGAKGARRPSLCEFIDDKLNEQRLRPAYDTQLRFHDEGADLPSADLSSIDSSTPYDELDHRFLATLGPKFSLFTDIYIQQHESSSDS